jgi:hypothetical protein
MSMNKMRYRNSEIVAYTTMAWYMHALRLEIMNYILYIMNYKRYSFFFINSASNNTSSASVMLCYVMLCYVMLCYVT